MDWLAKPNKIYIDLVVSWLRSETEKLNNVLDIIERKHTYHDDYIKETVRNAELSLRQMRKFIDAN